MTDIPGDSTTTATLTVGGSASSTIDTPTDHDWFKITLTAGQAVDVLVTLGTLEDSYLNIRDSSGNIIYSNDDIVDGVERNSEVKFDPSYTGTYYIDVSSWQDPNLGQGDGYTGTGTYTVSVNPYTPPPLATNDQIANQLTSGYWGGDVHHWAVSQGGTLTVDIHTLTAAEQTLAIAALQEWSDIIGVTFQQVTSGAQIVFDDGGDTTGKNPVAQTNANWANGIITSANVEISKSWVTSYGTSLDSYSFQTYIHEIGHALGLGHAGNYNNDATYPYDALFANDAWSTSIMSYFSQQDNTYFSDRGFSLAFALTPMVADDIAMQNLYGLSTTTRTGDTIYGDHSNAGGIYNASSYPDIAYTIFDSGGNDTIDYSLSSANQVINLNPETFSNVNGYTGNLEIARGVVIENAIGGSGGDTLIGNSANNVLTGNAGSDTLTGGGGHDVFKDTEANHNGDTITDFDVGDSIIFTNATLSTFTYSMNGNLLMYTGGSMNVEGLRPVKLAASAAPSGGVQLTELHGVTNDFNDDARSDILWRNDSGQITDWLSNIGSFSPNAANLLNSVSIDWQIAGTGDFNGDGHTDVLWRNADGRITDWLGTSSGGLTDNAVNALNSVSTDWQIAGIGDFNGDGYSDILWRNADGRITDWLGNGNGGFTPNSTNFYTSVSSDWKVVGVGDFNGDGYTDIMWRNVDGRITNWLGKANGGFTDNVANAYNGVSLDWHVAGIGDFNGDGRDDILWVNNDGRITDWLSTANGGYQPNSANFYTSVGANWHVDQIGDFNGDGTADILWRNDAGQIADWLGTSNGSFTTYGAMAITSVDTHWHVVPESQGFF